MEARVSHSRIWRSLRASGVSEALAVVEAGLQGEWSGRGCVCVCVCVCVKQNSAGRERETWTGTEVMEFLQFVSMCT